jgi:hypothetical protein
MQAKINQQKIRLAYQAVHRQKLAAFQRNNEDRKFGF